MIISQQEDMTEDIVREIGVKKEKVVTLHNPIDVETIDSKLKNIVSPYPQNSKQNFVWVARFNPQKGQDIAIDAFVKVVKHMPESHLYFVGKYNDESEYFKRCSSRVEELNLKDNVHFVGFDSNPYRWIKFADCLVLPSRIEGLPNTLIEAQYIGTPAAAVKCIPIIERIVKDGVNGYTAASEDPESLAIAMVNAAKLGRVKMTYESASNDDVVALF